jgi:hypothetical protein
VPLFKAGNKFEVLATNKLSDRVNATPVIADDASTSAGGIRCTLSGNEVLGLEIGVIAKTSPMRRVGVTTVQSLATLKDFVPSTGTGNPTELVPAPGREAQVKQIGGTWSVGPRLDELIHRARSFRRSVRKDGTQYSLV